MKYVVKQIMAAAPGMYVLEPKTKTAQLIVMWALTETVEEDGTVSGSHVLGLTVHDMVCDLQDVVSDILLAEDAPTFTTNVPREYTLNR